MPNPEAQNEPVVVNDRRRFTPTGEIRPDAPPPEPPAAPVTITAETPKGGAAEAPAPPAGEAPAATAAQEPAETNQYFLAVIESLYYQAMIHLGMVEHPQTHRPESNPEAGRETIEMLSSLQSKSKGNLSAEEKRALEEVIYQLRMAYLNLTTATPAPAPPAPKSAGGRR
jgi:hypothetical protein